MIFEIAEQQRIPKYKRKDKIYEGLHYLIALRSQMKSAVYVFDLRVHETSVLLKALCDLVGTVCAKYEECAAVLQKL